MALVIGCLVDHFCVMALATGLWQNESLQCLCFSNKLIEQVALSTLWLKKGFSLETAPRPAAKVF